MDRLKSTGKKTRPAKPYKGKCYDCDAPAPIGLYQCNDCHRRARKALEPMWPNQDGE